MLNSFEAVGFKVNRECNWGTQFSLLCLKVGFGAGFKLLHSHCPLHQVSIILKCEIIQTYATEVRLQKAWHCLGTSLRHTRKLHRTKIPQKTKEEPFSFTQYENTNNQEVSVLLTKPAAGRRLNSMFKMFTTCTNSNPQPWTALLIALLFLPLLTSNELV